MIIQSVNRTDPERVWVAVTNSEGATMTTHWPVAKFLGYTAPASLATNEAGLSGTATTVATLSGSFIGLADEDIPNGDVGLVQVYGYHESVLAVVGDGDITVRPGTAIGPLPAGSVGLTSTGDTYGHYGPVVALDTIGIAQTSAALATAGNSYANHVFIRAM